MVKTCIITHVDADAIAAAALYLYCKNIRVSDAEVFFIPPRDLVKALRRCEGRCKEVLIMDLGLNPGTFESVVKIVKELVDSGVNVKWFDHHVWDDEWIRRLRDVGVELYLDREICAAGIVARYACGKLVDLADVACSIDLWRFDKWEAPYFYRIVEYFASEGMWIKLVHRLIELDCDVLKLINEYEALVETIVSDELCVVSKALRKARVVALSRARICIYIKNDAERRVSTSLMCNAMLGRGLCDIAAVVRRDLKALSLRSTRCDVREIAKALGGGGHPRAAGAPLALGGIMRLMLAIAKAIGLRRVVEQIVIGKVRRKLVEIKSVIDSACGE